MSSTNKTTNYELSQFIGTDKPAWLGDYNTDMGKIDAQMKLNADGITAASGSATSANTAIGTLANLTTTVKTDLVSAINEVDSNADTAQGTANSAYLATGVNAGNIQTIQQYLDINTFKTPTATISGGTISSQTIGTASNTAGTLGKIYGRIKLVTTGSTATVTIPTDLRPSESITVNGIVNTFWSSNNADNWIPNMASISIATNGDATVTISDSVNGRGWILNFEACLIFAKEFGDIVIPD